MSNELFIPVLQGTSRANRKSIQVSNYIYEALSGTEGVKSLLVDPKDYNFPNDGNDPEGKDPRYTKITLEADAFFIVTPEYNHSYPGSLKRMLDSELKNYIHKPVAIAGVSDGNWGGVRAIEALLHPLREMGMAVTFSDVQVPYVQDAFEKDGKPIERIQQSVDRAITELLWMTKTFKYGRENIPSQYHTK